MKDVLKDIKREIFEEEIEEHLIKLFKEGGWLKFIKDANPQLIEDKTYSVMALENLDFCLSCLHKHNKEKKAVVVGLYFHLDTLDIVCAGYCKECFREDEKITIEHGYEFYDKNTLRALFSDKEIMFYENKNKN